MGKSNSALVMARIKICPVNEVDYVEARQQMCYAAISSSGESSLYCLNVPSKQSSWLLLVGSWDNGKLGSLYCRRHEGTKYV
eukprot:5018364-Amphidinium_carterae.2